MLIKTAAIVLHRTPYSDNGTIVHLFSREKGKITVFMRGRGKRTVLPRALMQPFSVVDLVIDFQQNRTMHYVRESQSALTFQTIPFDPVKSAVTLFLAEVIYHVARDLQADIRLFDFLTHSIAFLDASERGTANFHLIFLFKMTYFLGFYPNLSGFDEGVLFDMRNSCFCSQAPPHIHYLNVEQTRSFAHLMRGNYETMHLFRLSRTQRHDILMQIIDYYRLHIPGFGDLLSLDVLTELFD
ncbi:MAG: DNA repair protein RecO [Prevotellaceae bacterium]|jgi:DNA repair protein RecO (recombination protein O)|nr:DNA repair protein RecO [Prevotellaceae bacterium]